MPRLHIFGYISLCLIWGSTWMAVHVLIQDVPPFEAAFFRFLLASILLWAWVLFRKPVWPSQGRQWNALLALGFTMIGLPYALQFWAQQHVSSSFCAVLYSAVPLVVALLTPLMMQHTIPRQGVLAMLVGFGGLLALLYTDVQFGSRAFWGGIAVLASMLSSAWSAVYAKQRLQGVDPIIATAMQLLVGAVGLLWATWALEPHRHAAWTKSAILALLFLSAFGSATAFAIYYWLLQHLQPYQVSTINMVIPVVAVIEGALVFREPVSLMMIVAMVLVLASVGVVLRAEAETTPIELVPTTVHAKTPATTNSGE